MNKAPLIIIGAGRSGTNLLRDTLTSLENFATWPCDEINLIWRHGNIAQPHDVFGPELATPKVTSYIRGQFDKLQRRTGADIIIEKTCANSLRIPFIDAIFPEARYLYIVRDGRDVAISAMRRWTSGIDISYLVRKLRFAPPTDIPIYAMNFARNRIKQMQSPDRRQGSWGPRFPDIDDWAKTRPLVEVCARQWAECVRLSDEAFAKMPDHKSYKIHYEDFVSDPKQALVGIESWLGTDIISTMPAAALASINTTSKGTWKNPDNPISDEAAKIMMSVLKAHGYVSAA